MPDITATKPTAGAPIDTPWGQQVHDMLEGIQAGSVSTGAVSAGNKTVAVTFPRAYTVAPVVLVASPAGSFFFAGVGSITTTGFSLSVKDIRDAQAGTAGDLTVPWVAIGTPA